MSCSRGGDAGHVAPQHGPDAKEPVKDEPVKGYRGPGNELFTRAKTAYEKGILDLAETTFLTFTENYPDSEVVPEAYYYLIRINTSGQVDT